MSAALSAWHGRRWLHRGAVASLAALLCAMLYLGWDDGLAQQLYFHPGRDPLWRGVLAQLVHLNAAHLALNLAGLLGLSLVAQVLGRLPALLGVLCVSACAVTAGLCGESQPIAWYVGLSGALYGVGAWLPLALALRTEALSVRVAALLVCGLLGLKVALHLKAGELLGLPVAANAHVYGYLGGLACAVMEGLIAKLLARMRWR